MDNALLSCILNRDTETLKGMLNDANVDREDMLRASIHAASVKAKDILNVFLSKGLHINDILVEVVKHSSISAIDVLYEMGGDVNYERDGYSLMTTAAVHHNIECMEKLLQCGAKLNVKTAEGETCLTCLARDPYHHSEELEYLITKGADVNLSNDKGETPLYFAAEYGNVCTLRSLLLFGAQINHQNHHGETALMMASVEHHEQCVSLLLQHGAEENLQSLRGDTALMRNIKTISHPRPSYSIIDLLLQSGCNTDVPDSEGQTCLFLAIQRDDRKLVRRLLQFGADIFTETNRGMTPFLASIITGYDELASRFIDMECFVSGHIKNRNWKEDTPLVGLVAIALSTTINKENSETLNRLFFGAGETIPLRRIHQPHTIAMMAMETKYETLMTITRHAIRSYLSGLSPVNLITKITKLPLPTSLKNFLYFL